MADNFPDTAESDDAKIPLAEQEAEKEYDDLIRWKSLDEINFYPDIESWRKAVEENEKKLGLKD